MLTKIRKAADNWLFKGLLLIIVLSFCIWGVSDILRSSQDDKLVTFDYSKPIYAHEFVEAQKKEINRIQNMTGVPLTSEQIKELNLPQMVLEQLINHRMLDQLVNNYDMNFSNNIILKQIQKLPIFHNEKGEFDPKILMYFLKNLGISEDQYIANIKNQIGEEIILSIFGSSSLAPVALTQNITDYFNETRNIEVLSINPSNIILKHNKISEEVLRNFYEANKQHYLVPEERNFSYIFLSKDSIKKNIQIIDVEIEKLYQENIEEYKRPETFTFYNLFFADYESARKAMDDLKSNSSFDAQVAAIMGRPVAEVIINRVPLQGLEAPIAATLKTSPLNSLTGVVKTEKGYHLLKKVEQIPAINKSLNLVKNELIEQIKSRKLEEKFSEITKNIEDEIGAGSNLSEIAKKYNLKIEQILAVTAENFPKKLNSILPSESAEKLFNLKEGEISDLFERNNKLSGIIIFEATKIIPQMTKNFDEVKTHVQNKYIEEQKFKEALDVITTAVKKSSNISQGNNEILVKSAPNYKVSRADLITQSKKTYPIELLYKVFLTEKGQFTDIIHDNKAIYVARVKEIMFDKSNSKLNKKAVEEKVHTNFNNNIFEEIIIDFRKKNNIKINEDKINNYLITNQG